MRKLAEGLTEDQQKLYAQRMWHLVRYYMPYVTPAEWVVISWLTQRTIAFNKLVEEVPLRHFLGGVSWDGAVQIHPITLSESTLKRALRRLVSQDILLKQGGSAHANTYMLNLNWREGGSYRPAPEVKLTPQGGHNDLTYNNTVINNTVRTGRAHAHAREAQLGLDENATKEEPMPTDAVAALRTKMQQTIDRTNSSIEKNKKKLNATALQDIWSGAFRKAHPTEKFFPWRIYEQAAFKKAVHAHVPLSVAEEFVTYCVKNFANVIGERLSWMKTPPRLPDVGFVTKQIATFWLAFDDSNDPNRVIKHRMAEAANSPTKIKVRPKPSADVAKLKTENKALREKLRDVAQKTIDQKAVRGRQARKLVTSRKSSDPEFGSWDN